MPPGKEIGFQPGEGLSLQDAVTACTRTRRAGLSSTDTTILNMMTGKEHLLKEEGDDDSLAEFSNPTGFQHCNAHQALNAQLCESVGSE